MRLNTFIKLLPLLLFFSSIKAQYMEDYTKAWEGQFETSEILNFTVEIEILKTEKSVFKISNNHSIINQFFLNDNNLIDVFISEKLSFKGSLLKIKQS